MFGNKELEVKLESLNKEINDLNADNLRCRKRINEMENIVESFDIEKKALHKKNADYKKEIEVLKVQHEVDLGKVEKGIYHKVNATLASMGVDAFATEYFSEKKPDTDIQIMNTFNSLSGNEKTEFYNKNKAAITRVLLNPKGK